MDNELYNRFANKHITADDLQLIQSSTSFTKIIDCRTEYFNYLLSQGIKESVARRCSAHFIDKLRIELQTKSFTCYYNRKENK